MRTILKDIVQTLKSSYAWLLLFLAVTAAQAALAPSVAWITKEVIDYARIDTASVEGIVLQFGPIWLLISCSMILFKFGDKFLNKIVQMRVLISLQRVYLDRDKVEHDAKDASRVLYGADVARKGMELFYKDSWRIITQITSVLLWQLSLAPEWIPLMLMSVIPSMLFVWFLGPYIQRSSLGILNLQGLLVEHTRRVFRREFAAKQEALYKESLRFEVFKWTADEAMNILTWIILALLIAFAWHFQLSLLPNKLDLAEVGAFIVNLRLLAKPMGNVSKVYTKWCEAKPAMIQIFQPQSQSSLPSEPVQALRSESV